MGNKKKISKLSRRQMGKRRARHACAIKKQKALNLCNVADLAAGLWKLKGEPQSTSQQLPEDEWISCQADANKLVQADKRQIDEDYFRKEEPLEENVLLEENKLCLPETIKQECPTETPPASPQDKRQIDSEEWQALIENPLSENDFTIKTETIPDVDEWVIKKQLCRCCLAEGTFDSLTTIATGEDISYDDILLSFSIELFPVEAAARGALRGVCGLCAARLRDAHAFRHQVHASDARFRALYTRNCITVSNINVDIELEETAAVSDEFDPGFDENPTNELLLIEMKSESTASKSKITKNVQLKKKEVVKSAKTTSKSTKSKRKTGKSAGRQPKPKYFTLTDDYKKCTLCEHSCRNTKRAILHFRRVHLRLSLLKCELCDAKLTTKHELIFHKIQEHNIDERYKCGACDKFFNRQNNLTIHLESFHMLGEIIKCTGCDYETYSRQSMRRHMFKHKTSKDYHCRYCKKSFLRSATLMLHERIHTGDKRKACAECGQAFVQKASLNYHMAKYHPEVKF